MHMHCRLPQADISLLRPHTSLQAELGEQTGQHASFTNSCQATRHSPWNLCLQPSASTALLYQPTGSQHTGQIASSECSMGRVQIIRHSHSTVFPPSLNLW